MKKSAYILVTSGLIAYLLYLTFWEPSVNPTYVASVQAERKKKENFLRTSSQSPFVQENEKMEELNYFPIDSKYKVSAQIERIETRQTVRLSNSDGSIVTYLKFAYLNFELDNTPVRLLVLKPQFGVGFFLGFADETSGEQTYGGGRYLDVGELKGDRVELDFNLAYNPYCAYSAKFQCPLPPRENFLPVAIKAGEKIYGELLEL